MINGTRVDLFVSNIYKELCKILNNHFDELNILNKDLFDKINNTQQPCQPYCSFREHIHHDNSHEFANTIYSESQ